MDVIPTGIRSKHKLKINNPIAAGHNIAFLIRQKTRNSLKPKNELLFGAI
ncbi:MAG: hypothetical protein ABIN91_01970 [Mucilaginibacter sp.]